MEYDPQRFITLQYWKEFDHLKEIIRLVELTAYEIVIDPGALKKIERVYGSEFIVGWRSGYFILKGIYPICLTSRSFYNTLVSNASLECSG